MSPTSRIKSLDTTIEKLRRNGGSGLKSMQDLAGIRIVEQMERNEQDELVGRIVSVFENEERPPKIIDRRIQPSFGYRAVHVVVFTQSARRNAALEVLRMFNNELDDLIAFP